MFHPAYFEYALLVAAVVALPARQGWRFLRTRKTHARRAIPLQSREENRIKTQQPVFELVEPAKPEPAKPIEKPKVKEEVPTDSDEVGPPEIATPTPQGILWSNDDFRLETQQANITLGPAWLVFKQLRPIPISPDIPPTSRFRLHFPIPENSFFAHQVQPYTPRDYPGMGFSQDLPSRPIGLVISYPLGNFPIVADPNRTGLPRNVFPYYPAGLLGGNSTASVPPVGIIYTITRPNNGLIVPGPSRVIQLECLYDGVSGTTIGRIGQLWIFFTLTGVSGLPQGVLS